ncbi:MAG: Clp protease N-terminal domain-containing protein [Terriglobales bacterium]
MFERYTEAARRAIFFARYEASQHGATAIGSLHLLLGLLRESGATFTLAGNTVSVDNIIEDCRKALPSLGEKTSTSVDMPLTEECKRALAEAAVQAELQSSRSVTPQHLTLGLMEASQDVAAILRKHGVTPENLGAAPHSQAVTQPAASSPALLEFMRQGKRIATSPIHLVNPLPRTGDEVTFTREAKTETYKVLSVRQCFEGPPLTKTLAHCWLVKVVVEVESI